MTDPHHVYRFDPVVASVLNLIAGYRGSLGVAAIYLDLVARQHRAKWLIVSETDPENAGLHAETEHRADVGAGYVTYAYDATSPLPEEERAWSFGEPVEFKQIREHVQSKAMAYASNGFVSYRDLTSAVIGHLAEAGYVLALARGLRHTGVNNLSEFPRWHFDGAGTVEHHLAWIVGRYGWLIELPRNQFWVSRFSQPVGSPGNIPLPYLAIGPN